MQKSEFDKCRRNPATSGRRFRIPTRKFDRIRLDQVISGRIPTILAKSGRNLPDPAGSMAESGHIQPDPGRFGHLRPDPAVSRPFWPDPASLAGIQQYFGRNLVRWWPDSDNRITSNSGADWIPTTDNC